MTDEQRKYWFFGSKLNTGLLLVLIILMVIALRWMYQNKETYFPKQITTTEGVKSYQIEGNKDDLVSFSVQPGQEVSGTMKVRGVIKGGYFFEGNLPLVILDAHKQQTIYGPGHASATTDWMTAGPVTFSATIDFGPIPKGNYFIKISQDDPSGGESGKLIKSILIPILVQ